jgi:hypothetical protein
LELSRLRFVLLHYSPTSAHTERPEIRVLVISRASGIEVHTEQRWQEGLSAQDCEYLSELIRDWEQTTDTDTLLRELEELSIGPLRTIDSGMLDGAARQALIRAICSTPLK